MDGLTAAPCGDCAFRRNAVPGWLGDADAQDWIRMAHGETRIECHTRQDHAQCAGAAIYRTNVHKLPRDRSLLLLPADRGRVFTSAADFVAYHEQFTTPAED